LKERPGSAGGGAAPVGDDDRVCFVALAREWRDARAAQDVADVEVVELEGQAEGDDGEATEPDIHQVRREQTRGERRGITRIQTDRCRVDDQIDIRDLKLKR